MKEKKEQTQWKKLPMGVSGERQGVIGNASDKWNHPVKAIVQDMQIIRAGVLLRVYDDLPDLDSATCTNSI